MTPPTSIRTYRTRFGGGAPSRVIEIRTPSLEPLLLTAPAAVRAREVADIFAAKVRAPVAAVALPPPTLSATLAPEWLRRRGSDTCLTLRAVLGRLIAEGELRVSMPAGSSSSGEPDLGHPHPEVERWLAGLRRDGVLAVAARAGADDTSTLVLPVGELGHLRSAGASRPDGEPDRVLVNTHFFLLSAVELDSSYAAIGDVFGLVAAEGRVLNPPTVRRSALVRTARGWRIAHIGAEDLEIEFPDGTVVRGAGAEVQHGRRSRTGFAVLPSDSPVPSKGRRTRAGGPAEADVPELWYRGRTLGGRTASWPSTDASEPSEHTPLDRTTPTSPTRTSTTPAREGALDVCIQGGRASVIRHGGGLRIPHGALVVSFSSPPSMRFVPALEADPRVRLSLPSLPAMTTGFQVGPELVRDGDIVVGAASFEEERFRTRGSDDPTGPVEFPADHDRTSAARVGAGILADGTLVVIAVEGASSLTGPVGDQSAGCTLEALARLLKDAGAIDALNFDGGGSTQVFQGAQAILASADTRGVMGASFDRPVPVAGVAAGVKGTR